MPARTRFSLIFALCSAPATVFGDAPAKPADGGVQPRHAAAQGLISAVNAVAPADVGISPADVAPCLLDELPSARAKLLPLLPPEHRRLIADCARGRTRVRRSVRAFDLLALLDDPVPTTADAAPIREFFEDRAVDVATGSAISDGPYPISFDWAVVLDAETHTLYSFVLNCRD